MIVHDLITEQKALRHYHQKIKVRRDGTTPTFKSYFFSLEPVATAIGTP